MNAKFVVLMFWLLFSIGCHGQEKTEDKPLPQEQGSLTQEVKRDPHLYGDDPKDDMQIHTIELEGLDKDRTKYVEGQPVASTSSSEFTMLIKLVMRRSWHKVDAYKIEKDKVVNATRSMIFQQAPDASVLLYGKMVNPEQPFWVYIIIKFPDRGREHVILEYKDHRMLPIFRGNRDQEKIVENVPEIPHAPELAVSLDLHSKILEPQSEPEVVLDVAKKVLGSDYEGFFEVLEVRDVDGVIHIDTGRTREELVSSEFRVQDRKGNFTMKMNIQTLKSEDGVFVRQVSESCSSIPCPAYLSIVGLGVSGQRYMLTYYWDGKKLRFYHNGRPEDMPK